MFTKKKNPENKIGKSLTLYS